MTRRHVYRCLIRWSDMDAYQHVNNAVFLTYLEEARSDMLGIHAAKAGVDTFTTGCVSARHEIEYKAPLEWRPEAVTIEVWITEARAVSFNVAYEVKDDCVPYAKAAWKMVPYNLETRRPRLLTDAEREYLTRFLEVRTGLELVQ